VSLSKKEIKELKAAANSYAQRLKLKAPDTMFSLAVKGNEQVFAHSGGIVRPPTAIEPYDAYLTELASQLPWAGLTPALDTRPHTSCAEAHLWCELKARGKNPRSYTLLSFNQTYVVASPCANCAQWVERAFGTVYKETPSYEGRTRQRPR
jgi:hypothetical protein